MSSPLLGCLAALSLLASPALLGQAAPGPANPGATPPDRAVVIKDVKFAQTRLNGMATNPWNRVEVVVDPKSNPDPKALNRRWVDKVKVTATLVYKIAGKPAEEWNYYRATATVLTLEVNSARSVFFYLPGDVVKRDNLRKDPDHYFVEVEVAGTQQTLFDARGTLVQEQRNAVSRTLANKPDFEGAKGFADRGSMLNAGILRPQYLVDIVEDVARFSPEFVREDFPSR
jgi:hypothetical protein